jgi:hypothetical protein
MKPILIALVLCIALALVGCSAGETTQDQVEKDAKSITLDPTAKPDPSATADIKQAPPPGQQYGKKPYGG